MLTAEHHTLPNGDVLLSTGNDPIAIRAKGWHRFVLGVDLGQAHDNTALIGVEDLCVPIWSGGSRQVLGPRSLTVRYAEAFRGVSYPAIVEHVVRTIAREPFAGRVQLVLDHTGLGRVVGDMLEDVNIPFTGVTMSAGQNWTRKGQHVTVAKTALLEELSVAFASGELTFAHDLPMKDEILAELETFSLETTNAGNQIIAQTRTKAGHGDAAIALAIAVFAARHLTLQEVRAIPIPPGWSTRG